MQNYLGSDMPLLPWMLNFECPQQETCYEKFKKIQNANSLDFQANLALDPELGRRVLTKLSCSIGPRKATTELLGTVLHEGITSICVATSHHKEEDVQKLLHDIRNTIYSFSSNCGRVYPVGIFLELTSVHIRTGFLKDKKEVTLKTDEFLRLTTRDEFICGCTKTFVYVNFKEILNFLKPNDLIYIDYGKIVLQVTNVYKQYNNVKCVVKYGGKLRSEAIVYIPNIPIELETVDYEMIALGLANEVDGFVVRAQCAHDIQNVRDAAKDDDPSAMVFANIETTLAVLNIDEIIKTADGIILCRDLLNLAFPIEKMFVIQKSIIAKCNKVGVPVLCRLNKCSFYVKTHQSKYEEIIDVANMVLDGCTGLILTEDILMNKNLLSNLQLLKTSCLEAESAIFQRQFFANVVTQLTNTSDLFETFALSTVDLAIKSNAVVIIINTVSGLSAKIIAKYKPPCPLICVTRYGHIARKLNFWRALVPVHFVAHLRENWEKDVRLKFDYAITYGKYQGLIKGGDPILLINSGQEGQGFLNSVKLVYASAVNCVSKTERDHYYDDNKD